MALSKIILEDQEKNSAEIENLRNDLLHINQIVDMQKTIGGISSLKEQVYIPELIDTALNIAMSPSFQGYIKVIKQFNLSPQVYIDKSRLLQILINVIQNAKEAVLDNSSAPIKEIKLSTEKTENNSIEIIIEDNGVGIKTEHLDRIFSFGFTTKTNGHGFGLHSSALAATEMGGTLRAKSRGEGCGAQFILKLPMELSESLGELDE